jgi:hypothetical protein
VVPCSSYASLITVITLPVPSSPLCYYSGLLASLILPAFPRHYIQLSMTVSIILRLGRINHPLLHTTLTATDCDFLIVQVYTDVVVYMMPVQHPAGVSVFVDLGLFS